MAGRSSQSSPSQSTSSGVGQREWSTWVPVLSLSQMAPCVPVEPGREKPGRHSGAWQWDSPASRGWSPSLGWWCHPPPSTCPLSWQRGRTWARWAEVLLHEDGVGGWQGHHGDIAETLWGHLRLPGMGLTLPPCPLCPRCCCFFKRKRKKTAQRHK